MCKKICNQVYSQDCFNWKQGRFCWPIYVLSVYNTIFNDAVLQKYNTCIKTY